MANIVATGGTITTVGAYTVHTFNSSGTFQVTSGSGSVWYVVVAGGGGASAAAGGAGGYRTTGEDTYSYAVTVNSYTVTIGAGGAGANGGDNHTSGNDSVFDTITSLGGGKGGFTTNSNGTAGGSGGGGGYQTGTGGAGTAGQGFAGGNGDNASAFGAGGGGGASQSGSNGTNAGSGTGGKGGDGTASTITGVSVTRAGGGGGGGQTAGAAGGAGGGGAGSSGSGTSGTINTGGGGGGIFSSYPGGTGGSGVVVIRYLTAVTPPVADFSGTPTSGTAPLSVTFTDLSTNTPTSWAWTFGDGNTSTSQNPSNNYAAAGTYSVGLTATNADGSNLKTRTGYIAVSAATAVVSTEQASNWQATYWKNKSKADRENEEMLERIKLGILPPQERDEADVAVREADEASRLLAAGRMEAPDALLKAMEARERYEAAYRTVFEDAYIAEVVAEHWKEDMKRIARRRKAFALLLH